jgi:Fe-S cluster assembly ATPase SufC
MARQLVEKDPAVREFNEKHNVRHLLDSPYFQSFKDEKLKDNNEFLEVIVQETLEKEKDELERKLQEFVQKFHEKQEKLNADDYQEERVNKNRFSGKSKNIFFVKNVNYLLCE